MPAALGWPRRGGAGARGWGMVIVIIISMGSLGRRVGDGGGRGPLISQGGWVLVVVCELRELRVGVEGAEWGCSGKGGRWFGALAIFAGWRGRRGRWRAEGVEGARHR